MLRLISPGSQLTSASWALPGQRLSKASFYLPHTSSQWHLNKHLPPLACYPTLFLYSAFFSLYSISKLPISLCVNIFLFLPTYQFLCSPIFTQDHPSRASLVAQWLRIRLPMQGTQVRALVREDPTCRGVTKPVSHNYWARVLQLLKPAHLDPLLRNKRSHHNEHPLQQRVAPARRN